MGANSMACATLLVEQVDAPCRPSELQQGSTHHVGKPSRRQWPHYRYIVHCGYFCIYNNDDIMLLSRSQDKAQIREPKITRQWKLNE